MLDRWRSLQGGLRWAIDIDWAYGREKAGRPREMEVPCDRREEMGLREKKSTSTEIGGTEISGAGTPLAIYVFWLRRPNQHLHTSLSGSI